MASEKQIQKILNDGISYFGKDEVIYVYECKKCHKLDPVPSFIINEHLVFLKFIKEKKSFEMECPYCGGPSFPIRTSKDKKVYLLCDSLKTITFLFYLKQTHFFFINKKEH